ncbi:MAG: S-layer homology domain-containing protein [Clostridia bacterium]|nr:S-layer homology domain-containing protein [Clostridia bacterium]
MKKIIIAFILILAVISSSTLAFAKEAGDSKATDKKFTDIDKHWAEEAINQVADKSIFADKSGKFTPGKAITRSEFVMMLHKALGIQIMYFKAPDVKDYFEDVKNEDIYASALIDLVTANIIDYKGKFRPNDTLPRDEMVHYIINALEYKTGGNYSLIKMMPEPFADADKINPAYKNDFIKAQLLKLVLGKGKNMFHPEHKTTRSEAVMVTYRLLNVLKSLSEEVQVVPVAEKGEDSLKLKLMIVNNSETPVTIKHSSGQKFDFALLDSNKEVLYRWSSDKLFIMALTETVIEPGKSIEFSWDVEESILDSVKGKAAYMKGFITGESDDFRINPDGYEAQIR